MAEKNLKKLVEDATQLQETSIQQAKAMLAEDFAPTFTRYIAGKIREQDEEEILEPEEEEEIPGEQEEDTLDNIPEPTEEIPVEDEEEEITSEQDEEDIEIPPEEEELELPDEEEEDIEEIINRLSEQDEEESGIDDEEESIEDLPPNEDQLDDDNIEEIINRLKEQADYEDKEKVPDEDDEEEIPDKIGERIIKTIRPIKLENFKLRRENKILHRSLKEHKIAVRKAQKLINEVSLINAKLAYFHSLTNDHPLTRKEKLMMVSKLDEAVTVREAKLIYRSLDESLKVGLKSRKSNKGVRKVVNESVSHLIKKKETRPVATMRDQLVTEGLQNKWVALAGLDDDMKTILKERKEKDNA